MTVKDYRAELAKIHPLLVDAQMLNIKMAQQLAELVAAKTELATVTEERDAALLQVDHLTAELALWESGVRDLIDRLDAS